jgi:hypothetical protein
MKELDRFLTNMLSDIDIEAQVSTLDSHGFFSTNNQMKIKHHTITKAATNSPIKPSELENPTEVYKNEVFQAYMNDPFSTENYQKIRLLLAAPYDKLDEEESDSSDSNDDKHQNANEAGGESTKVVTPPFLAPWLTSKEMPPFTKTEEFADRNTVNSMLISVPVMHILHAHKTNQSVHAIKNDHNLVRMIHYYLEQHTAQYNSANPFLFHGIGATVFNLPNADTIADENVNIMGAAYFITKLVTSGLSLIGETPSDESPENTPSVKTVTTNLEEFVSNLKSVFMFHDSRSPQMTAKQVIADLGKCVSTKAIQFCRYIPSTYPTPPNV